MWTWWISEGNVEWSRAENEMQSLSKCLEALLSQVLVVCVIKNLCSSINKPSFILGNAWDVFAFYFHASPSHFCRFSRLLISFHEKKRKMRNCLCLFSILQRQEEKTKRRDQHQLTSKNPIKSTWRTKWLMRCVHPLARLTTMLNLTAIHRRQRCSSHVQCRKNVNQNKLWTCMK